MKEEQEPHFSTADAAASKTSPRLQVDDDAQSIPTDVELVQRGCFDDIVRERDRITLEDSKILSSILHQDSSHYQSQSALSLINVHCNRMMMKHQQTSPSHTSQNNRSTSFAIEVARNIVEAPTTRGYSSKSPNHGYAEKPISFGKDFAIKPIESASVRT